MLDVKLVVVGGAQVGDEFKIKLPCMLGRAREASIPLPHPLVSRNHCELVERDGQLMVRDLNSTNGTFVGSERIQESFLRHGDLLTVGTVTFRATFAGEPIMAAVERPANRPLPATPTNLVNDTAELKNLETDVNIPVQKVRPRKQKAK